MSDWKFPTHLNAAKEHTPCCCVSTKRRRTGCAITWSSAGRPLLAAPLERRVGRLALRQHSLPRIEREAMTRDEALNEIGTQVQRWLDWQEREREEECLSCNDDTHMMRVPVWPTRGQLKEWVKILKTPNVELRGASRLYGEASSSNDVLCPAGREGGDDDAYNDLRRLCHLWRQRRR